MSHPIFPLMSFLYRIALILLFSTGLVGVVGAMDHSHHDVGHGNLVSVSHTMDHRLTSGHHASSEAARRAPSVAHAAAHADVCVADSSLGRSHTDHKECLGCCPDTPDSSGATTVSRTETDRSVQPSMVVLWSIKADVVRVGMDLPARPIPLASRSVLRL